MSRLVGGVGAGRVASSRYVGAVTTRAEVRTVDLDLRAALGCNARTYAKSWFWIKDIGERFEAISYTLTRNWPRERWLKFRRMADGGKRNVDLSAYFDSELNKHEGVVQATRALKGEFMRLCDICTEAVKRGNKIAFFGNGGSAGDAQHLITSGKSPNVTEALKVARKMGVTAAALSGKSGGALLDLADPPLIVPSQTTARIQEMNIMLCQMLCDVLEQRCG